MQPPTDEEAPHLAVIARSIDAGFRFVHLTAPDGCAVVAIHAERRRDGAVDTYTVYGLHEAVAARYPVEDYPHEVVWQAIGPVATVVAELFELPRHGHPGAPALLKPTSSSLWAPPGTWS